jgi:hypothetical protein
MASQSKLARPKSTPARPGKSTPARAATPARADNRPSPAPVEPSSKRRKANNLMWNLPQRTALVNVMRDMKGDYLDQFMGKPKKAEKVLEKLGAEYRDDFGDSWELVNVSAIMNAFAWLEKQYRKWKPRTNKTGQGLTALEVEENPECQNLDGILPL